MMKSFLLPLGTLVLGAVGSLGFLSCSGSISPTKTTSARQFSSTTTALGAVTSALPPILDADGSELSPDAISDKLANKRVALYFAAGWCPMCTSFEPSLVKFRDAAAEAGTPVEIIYVPSDRSESDQAKRASAMNMLTVPFDEADNLKLKHKIWSGAESLKLGFGRRSGVPALVVLDGEKGEEMAFIAAESQGVRALGSWPLDDERGVWDAPN
jgi:nucleoredoxin